MTHIKREPKQAELAVEPKVRMVASPKSWITGDAEAQLRRAAELPGVVAAVGMPDLHPGKGIPVGAAILSDGVVHPELAGNDIGCGMSLWQTEMPRKKLKLDRWARKLKGLESPMEQSSADRLAAVGLEPGPCDASLGTIGGGNHFAELQAVDAVEDDQTFRSLGLDESRLMLLVHSGSRGLGESVLRSYVARHGFGGVAEEKDAAAEYLAGHDRAAAWAGLNRTLIAERFLDMLATRGRPVIDLCHNSICPVQYGDKRHWLHRKGAAPSDSGAVVLPGSRGTLTYIVEPVGDQAANAFSVAHGAGRKWARSEAKSRLERRYSVDSLRRTDLGGRVICDDKTLLYEEAPQAYKNVDVVVRDLIDAGLVRTIATLKPLITYKRSNATR